MFNTSTATPIQSLCTFCSNQRPDMGLILVVCVLAFLCPSSVTAVGSANNDLDTIRQALLKYDADISRITAQNDDLVKRVEALERKNKELGDIVASLTTDNIRLKLADTEQADAIQKLQENDKAQREELETLKRQVSQKAAIAESDVPNGVQRKPYYNEAEDSEKLADSLRTKKSDQEQLRRHTRLLLDGDMDYNLAPRVAFTAKLGGHATELGNRQTVIFERVQTNVGNSYSADTGIFDAPVNGTYFFTATIMCHSGDYIETEIVHNGNHVVYMYAADGTRFEQGTNSAVLVLNAGDHVWVRNINTQGDTVYGNDWSTFSGFLLYI